MRAAWHRHRRRTRAQQSRAQPNRGEEAARRRLFRLCLVPRLRCIARPCIASHRMASSPDDGDAPGTRLTPRSRRQRVGHQSARLTARKHTTQTTHTHTTRKKGGARANRHETHCRRGGCCLHASCCCALLSVLHGGSIARIHPEHRHYNAAIVCVRQ